MSPTTLVLLAGAALAAVWALLEWHRRDRLAAALLAVGAVALTALVSFALTGAVLACAATTVFGGPRKGKSGYWRGGSSTPPARCWSPPPAWTSTNSPPGYGPSRDLSMCSTPSGSGTCQPPSVSTRSPGAPTPSPPMNGP